MTECKRLFGRDAAPDSRDKKFALKRRATTRHSKYWNDRAWFGDQGYEPSCVGFAWAHWLVNAPIVTFLNPTGIYNIAKFFDEWDGTDYDGTSVRGGAKCLQQLGLIKEYWWTWQVDVLASTILNDGPVVVGSNWYEGMIEPDWKGMVTVSGQVLGGHGYLVNGVNVRREVFRIKNSWGKGWGKYGRCFITFEDMHRLLKESGECCIGVEQAAKPWH